MMFTPSLNNIPRHWVAVLGVLGVHVLSFGGPLVDTQLGKSQGPHPLALLGQWGCGSLAWGCGGEEGGMYDQHYIGQHQQGISSRIPFTHRRKLR